jgi:hypothetical protein
MSCIMDIFFAIKDEEIFYFFMEFLLTAQEYVHYRRLSW